MTWITTCKINHISNYIFLKGNIWNWRLEAGLRISTMQMLSHPCRPANLLFHMLLWMIVSDHMHWMTVLIKFCDLFSTSNSSCQVWKTNGFIWKRETHKTKQKLKKKKNLGFVPWPLVLRKIPTHPGIPSGNCW